MNGERDKHINAQLKARGIITEDPTAHSILDNKVLYDHFINCFYDLYSGVNANGTIPYMDMVDYFKFHGLKDYYYIKFNILCIKELEIVYNKYKVTQERLAK